MKDSLNQKLEDFFEANEIIELSLEREVKYAELGLNLEEQ